MKSMTRMRIEVEKDGKTRVPPTTMPAEKNRDDGAGQNDGQMQNQIPNRIQQQKN